MIDEKKLIPLADEKLMAKWLLDIYNMGDKDECSIKHIGHGMASLLAFGTYKKADDYLKPTDRQMLRIEEVKLDALWDCVKKIIVRNGKQAVIDSLPRLAENYPQLFYVDNYLDCDWLSYYTELQNQNLVITERN